MFGGTSNGVRGEVIRHIEAFCNYNIQAGIPQICMTRVNLLHRHEVRRELKHAHCHLLAIAARERIRFDRSELSLLQAKRQTRTKARKVEGKTFTSSSMKPSSRFCNYSLGLIELSAFDH
jgi:hypothetical protein